MDRLILPAGRTLRRDEDVSVRQVRGRAVRQQLEQLMAKPAYERWPDPVRQRMVKLTIERARAQASKQLRRELTSGSATAAGR